MTNAHRWIVVVAIVLAAVVWLGTRDAPKEAASESDASMPGAVSAEIESRNDSTDLPSSSAAAGPSGPASLDEARFPCIEDYWSRKGADRLDLGSVMSKLGTSADVDQLIATLIYRPAWPAEPLFRISDALEIAPKDPRLAYLLSYFCVSDPGRVCNDEWMDLATSSDPDNGAIWLNAAVREFRLGDEEAAFQNMQMAAATGTFTDHAVRNAVAFGEAMLASGAMSFTDGFHHGLAMTRSMTIGFQPFTDACRTQPATDRSWAGLCRNLGLNMNRQSKEYLTRGLGLGLARISYESLNDVDSARKISEEMETLQSSLQIHAADKLVWIDEELLLAWIDDDQDVGEIAARQRLIERANARLEDPDYDPCRYVVVPN